MSVLYNYCKRRFFALHISIFQRSPHDPDSQNKTPRIKHISGQVCNQVVVQAPQTSLQSALTSSVAPPFSITATLCFMMDALTGFESYHSRLGLGCSVKNRNTAYLKYFIELLASHICVSGRDNRIKITYSVRPFVSMAKRQMMRHSKRSHPIQTMQY